MSSTLPNRRAVFGAAAAGYAAVFVLFAVFGRPGLGIGHGFYLPIILVALATDPRGGFAAGVLATTLYALAAVLSVHFPAHEIVAAPTIIRAVAFVAVGTVVGCYASRNRALNGRLTDLTRHLEALAVRDVLTGLPNLRGFDLAITGRLADERPFGLLVGDLDDLGALNAAGGHDTGDDVLRAVADALADHLPVESDVARVGGDEFAILVPCGTIDDAAELASELERVLDRAGCRVTFGWAMYPREATSALSLYRAADERLYARKLLRGYLRPGGLRRDAA
jgi:diguanylate cyclase (GGDEF)-like protein